MYLSNITYLAIFVSGDTVRIQQFSRRPELEGFIDRTMTERLETHDHTLQTFGHKFVNKTDGSKDLLLVITTIR